MKMKSAISKVALPGEEIVKKMVKFTSCFSNEHRGWNQVILVPNEQSMCISLLAVWKFCQFVCYTMSCWGRALGGSPKFFFQYSCHLGANAPSVQMSHLIQSCPIPPRRGKHDWKDIWAGVMHVVLSTVSQICCGQYNVLRHLRQDVPSYPIPHGQDWNGHISAPNRALMLVHAKCLSNPFHDFIIWLLW